MTVPLWILAGLSIFGGLLNVPVAYHLPGAAWLHHWLHPIIPELPGVPGAWEIEHLTEFAIAGVSVLIAVTGWWMARRLYKDRELAADETFEQRSPGLARALENKWYVDEFYGAVVVRPLALFSRFLWKIIDAAIDGIAAMLGFVVRGFGDLLRFFQTGNVRNYALMFFLGVVVFIAVLL